MAKPDVSGFKRKLKKSVTPRVTSLEPSPRLASKLVDDHEDTYLNAGKNGRKSHSRRSVQAMSKPQKRGRA